MQIVLKDLVFDIDWAMLGAGIPDPYWTAKYYPAGTPGSSGI